MNAIAATKKPPHVTDMSPDAARPPFKAKMVVAMDEARKAAQFAADNGDLPVDIARAAHAAAVAAGMEPAKAVSSLPLALASRDPPVPIPSSQRTGFSSSGSDPKQPVHPSFPPFLLGMPSRGHTFASSCARTRM